MKTTKHHYRSIFISDTHLGFRGCKDVELHEFLKMHTAENIFLLGDILDLISMRTSTSISWPKKHSKIVALLMKRARSGTNIHYIMGNHDSMLREFDGMRFDSIKLHGEEMIHTLATGQKIVLIHGDQFDQIIQKYLWLAKIGSIAYDVLIAFNSGLNQIRSWFRLRYWSFSAFIKRKIKSSLTYTDDFVEAAIVYAKTHESATGIICGHIHHVDVQYKDAMLIYANCGDWIETSSALVEDFDGKISIIHHRSESR